MIPKQMIYDWTTILLQEKNFLSIINSEIKSQEDRLKLLQKQLKELQKFTYNQSLNLPEFFKYYLFFNKNKIFKGKKILKG